ncbi:hypothetical protein N7495_009537 [Penicillium taxi]|uniref:uncharacterized protein n=1 Tax=Penicillium taxi TaxID=168475 RepID=UPI0025456B92|nr:uncharacterized protein N7495_009537 [Penicillium taxi]KAJ5885027.1 hypothetical protein N7495_009537 [Penicillium taxi]
MRLSIFLAAALATLVKADDKSSTEIVGYFSPSWDVGMLEYGGWTSTAASLASLNTKAATYHVGCSKDAPKTDCNMKNSYTIIQGPETVNVDMIYTASTSNKESSYDLTVTESWDCSMKQSTLSLKCTMSIGVTGTQDGASYVSSTSTKKDYPTVTVATDYYQLTVTAGLASATQTAGAAAGPAAALITAAPIFAAAVAAML